MIASHGSERLELHPQVCAGPGTKGEVEVRGSPTRKASFHGLFQTLYPHSESSETPPGELLIQVLVGYCGQGTDTHPATRVHAALTHMKRAQCRAGAPTSRNPLAAVHRSHRNHSVIMRGDKRNRRRKTCPQPSKQTAPSFTLARI